MRILHALTSLIVIATGGEPFVPDLPGLREAGALTSETLWERLSSLDKVPERLVIIGGETSQGVLRQFGVEHLQLGCALEPGVAQGLMLDGCFAGREFALKGGSMGREDTLEKMLCRKEVVY